MMGTDINLKVYVDAYLTEEGLGLYISPNDGVFVETIIPYKKLVEDYLEMYQVPSHPPTMFDEDRQKVTDLCNVLLTAIDYLRKLEHDTQSWEDHMGHRD